MTLPVSIWRQLQLRMLEVFGSFSPPGRVFTGFQGTEGFFHAQFAEKRDLTSQVVLCGLLVSFSLSLKKVIEEVV